MGTGVLVNRLHAKEILSLQDVETMLWEARLPSPIGREDGDRAGLPQCRQPVARVERVTQGLIFECPECGNRWSASEQGAKAH